MIGGGIILQRFNHFLGKFWSFGFSVQACPLAICRNKLDKLKISLSDLITEVVTTEFGSAAYIHGAKRRI
jgi:hypothetical protein